MCSINMLHIFAIIFPYITHLQYIISKLFPITNGVQEKETWFFANYTDKVGPYQL